MTPVALRREVTRSASTIGLKAIPSSLHVPQAQAAQPIFAFLNIEQKVHDITVGNDIVLAFGTHDPGRTTGCLALVLQKIFV